MKKKLIIIISVVAVLIVAAVAVYFVSMLSDTPSPEAEQEENELVPSFIPTTRLSSILLLLKTSTVLILW